MKKIIRLITLSLLVFCLPKIAIAQQTDEAKEKITTAFNDYFSLERESIHLHLDKEIFLSDEEIWFKGYVLNRKTNRPFLLTSNVFAVLYDSEGHKMSEQLLFANSGSFSGSFKLNDNYQSGTYFIQLYTNWMNNFTEDESAVFKVKILNTQNPKLLSENPDYSKINIDFHPEGGNFITGIKNIVGVRISDCSENPIPVKEGEIIDEKGSVVAKVFLNRFGYGKFEITPDSQQYKAVFTINGERTESLLPITANIGIALDINNYMMADKTISIIRANNATLNAVKNKPLFLVVQQDGKAAVFDVDFANGLNEQTLVFSNDYLYDGVNTIRIIDSDFKEIAQRLVFKYPEESSDLSISSADVKKGLFMGKLNFPNANISISVLPEKSIAHEINNDIYGSMLLNPYLNESICNASYYFDNPSKSKHYEIDLMLLNKETSKYNWQDILMKRPKKDYEFDFGLTLKGKLNQTLSDRKKYTVKLYSLKSFLNESAQINEQNEFFFKNLVLADSSWVNFTLIKNEGSIAIPMKNFIQITNGKRVFNKTFHPAGRICISKNNDKPVEYEIPKFDKDVTALNTVEIKTKEKPLLTRANQFGNTLLKGYKVVPQNNNMDVLDYIGQNGFDVTRYTSYKQANIAIYGRSRTTINAQRSSPVIYIDDFKILTTQELWGMKMEDIDEIYINASAIVPSLDNNIGIIKIYRKKGTLSETYKSQSAPFLIEDGFAKVTAFENSKYQSTADKGFENFGIIQWIPTMQTNENGSFEFTIPADASIKTVKVKIEGFTQDGRLISITKIINL